MLSQYATVFPYLRRYRGAYVVGLASIVVTTWLKLLIPRWTGEAMDRLEHLVEDGGAAADGRAELVRVCLLIVGTALVVGLTRTANRLAILGTCRRVAHDLRERLFDHLLRLAPSFYVRNPTGQIMSRCINDMQNVQGLMGPVVLYLVETATLFAIAIPMMASVSPLLTAAALLPFLPFLLVARRLARTIQEGSRAAQNSLGEVSAKVDESLSGQLVIKTMTLEEHDRARFRAHCERYRRLNLDVTRSRAWLIGLMTGLSALSVLVVLWLGAARVSLGEMVALMLYLGMLTGPTRTLSFVISSLRRGASALGRIREILDAQPALLDGPRADVEPAPRGELEVRGLRVVHPPLAEQPHLSGSLPALLEGGAGAGADQERVVLDDVSFRVPAGTTLGIVGHTGSGKTTLVRALARLQEVAPGQVFVDGVDVTELPLEPLRRRIGYVPQDAFLFSRSLADNVALGRPDATRADVERALDDALLAKDLDQLPQGLDTVVGERGVMLSGGQRQRAALARVLLLAPRVLILDDTLSAVDTNTSDEILARLRRFSSARTTILVAHRLATLRHADEILVLDEGRIAERGTHDELLAAGGLYAELWEQQERTQQRAARARELGVELDEEAAR